MSLGSPKTVRTIARGLAYAAAVLAVVAVRVVMVSADELGRGDAMRDLGEREAAIAHYRRAVRWYAPLSPYPTEALGRLRTMAVDAERRGDHAVALAAYRSMHAGIVASRSFYTPHEETLASVDRQIARLMAEETPPPIDGGRSQHDVERDHLQALRDAPRGRPGSTLLALLGFATWVVAAFAFARSAIDAEDRFVPHEVRRWGLAFVAGWVLFGIGLLQA